MRPITTPPTRLVLSRRDSVDRHSYRVGHDAVLAEGESRTRERHVVDVRSPLIVRTRWRRRQGFRVVGLNAEVKRAVAWCREWPRSSRDIHCRVLPGCNVTARVCAFDGGNAGGRDCDREGGSAKARDLAGALNRRPGVGALGRVAAARDEV